MLPVGRRGDVLSTKHAGVPVAQLKCPVAHPTWHSPPSAHGAHAPVTSHTRPSPHTVPVRTSDALQTGSSPLQSMTPNKHMFAGSTHVEPQRGPPSTLASFATPPSVLASGSTPPSNEKNGSQPAPASGSHHSVSGQAPGIEAASQMLSMHVAVAQLDVSRQSLGVPQNVTSSQNSWDGGLHRGSTQWPSRHSEKPALPLGLGHTTPMQFGVT